MMFKTVLYLFISCLSFSIANQTPSSKALASTAAASATSGTSSSATSGTSSSGGSGCLVPDMKSIGNTEFTGKDVTFYDFWKNGKHSCVDKMGPLNDKGCYAAIAADNYNLDVCGKWIYVEYNGKVIKVQITDRCADCPPGNIDLTDVAFQNLESKDKGRIKIKWKFV